MLMVEHIPDSEVRHDIHITEEEVKSFQVILAELRKNPPQNKLDIMRYEVRLKDREGFLANLKTLMEWRLKHTGTKSADSRGTGRR